MVGKNILILIILFVFIIFLMLFIINKNSAKSLSTKDSLLKKDSLVESFFKKTFNGKLVHFSDKSAIIAETNIVNRIILNEMKTLKLNAKEFRNSKKPTINT